MKRFLCILVVLAAVSFFAGLQSVGMGSRAKESAEPASRERQVAIPSGSDSKQRIVRPRLALAPEVLDRVEFDRFHDGKVTPVARKLFQLSREDCLQINDAMRTRGEELAVLREIQEGKAFRIDAPADWRRSKYCWEIPIDIETRRQIWLRFREQVASVVGEEICESLLGEFEHRDLEPGHRQRHLVVAFPGDALMRAEFTEVGSQTYNSWQTRMKKPEASQQLVAMIDQALEQAGEAPLRE